MDKFISAGIAGHVDHRKTSLVRCLTGIDTDRLKEEKRRGLSIEPSVAPLQLPSGGRIALVDVPGHSDFLKNTLRGLSAVDLAILVVAADDGVMPQTRDHLEVLNFLQAKGGCIVLSKADIVDLETLELAEMEIGELVTGSFLERKPVIPFSALDGRGLHKVVLAMENGADSVDGKSIDAPFRLWIDQVRSFPGFGAVVSGTVLSGNIRRDDTIELLPSGKQAKVRFIEVHHERVEQAGAGQRVGLNLHSIPMDEVSVGKALARPGLLSPGKLLNAELSLLLTARRPVFNRQRVKLYLGTNCTTALLLTMEKELIHPGETGLAQLRLRESLAVLPKDAFVISPMNLHTVIGGGRILEAPKEKFRAANAEKILGYLQPLQRDDAKSIVNMYFSRFPSRPVTAEEVVSATGLPAERAQAEIKSKMRTGKLLHLDGRGYFGRIRYEALKRQLVDITRKVLSQDAFKSAASGAEIRFRLDPNLDDALFEQMLAELLRVGRLDKTEKGYCIPNFVVNLPSYQEELMEQLVGFAQKQGYCTFSAGTFWKLHGEGVSHRDVEKVLDHLHAQKKLVRLKDGRYLTVEALQKITQKVKELIQRKGSLTLQDAAAILGYGRSRGIPVLEYLDALGLTRRVGAERVLGLQDTNVSNL